LALFGNDSKDLPNILDAFEMIAAVAKYMHHAHNSPSLQFTQTGADVRTCHSKRRRDLVSRKRLRRKKQQRVHLRHGAVNAPPCAHFTPVQNELLRDGRESAVLGFILFAHETSFVERSRILVLVLLLCYFSSG